MQPVPSSSHGNAKKHALYQELNLQGRLLTADPYELVKILYEELENALRVLKALDKRHKNIAGHSQAYRAHSILVALLNGLSAGENPNLSEALADVYQSMASTINIIIRSGDASQLDELINGVVNIRTAWEQIEDLQ